MILVLTVCAALVSGNDSVTAIRQWAARTPQEVLVRGDAPAPVIPTCDDEPVERERRRAATRAITHPAPAGLLPAAAIDGKLLHGSRTATGQVFLVAAISHQHGVILGQRQVPDNAARTRSSPTCWRPWMWPG